MFRTIPKFVQDPKYLDNMDEIVHFYRDLSLSAEKVDEFEKLFLQMSSKEDKCIARLREVMAQFN